MSNARKPRNRRGARQRRPGDRLGRFAPDLRNYAGLVQEANAAEARGDLEHAASIIERVRVGPDGKPFWAPWRELRLTQLMVFEGRLPGWAISRWLAAQALQQLDPGAGERSRRALGATIQVRGDALPGRSRLDARARVMERDWVYRQLFLYDEGGLRHFLPRVSPSLLAGADRIHEWVEARMGGYRLVACEPTTLRWEDLGDGARIETPNLGTASLIEVGECAIGRVVPIEGGVMFESAPLEVPDHVAEAVAAAPAEWLEVVRALVREILDEEGVRAADMLLSLGHDFGLLTDVPEALWRTASRGGVGHLCDDPIEVVSDALALLEYFCARPSVPNHVAGRLLPGLAAAVVVPGALPALRDRLGPDSARRLLSMADRLAEPAASLLRDLAWSLRRAS